MKLRTYRTERGAKAYAKKLAAKFPDAKFDVVWSTLWQCPFCYVIVVTKGGRSVVGGKEGAWEKAAVYVGR